jgi:hypothetical protein
MPRGDERFQLRKRNGDALGKGCCCGRIWAEGCFDSENWETEGGGGTESRRELARRRKGACT